MRGERVTSVCYAFGEQIIADVTLCWNTRALFSERERSNGYSAGVTGRRAVMKCGCDAFVLAAFSGNLPRSARERKLLRAFRTFESPPLRSALLSSISVSPSSLARKYSPGCSLISDENEISKIRSTPAEFFQTWRWWTITDICDNLIRIICRTWKMKWILGRLGNMHICCYYFNLYN